MEEKLLPKWMMQTLGLLLIIFVLLLIIGKVVAINGSPQTMKVNAVGKVAAVPDLATVNVGVVSEGTDPVDVKNKNNDKINQIITFVKGLGISEKDIKTSGFYASPKYNYANGQNAIVGFRADQTITVIVRNIDKSQDQLEKMLDGVVNAGANEIQGVNFSFVDTDKLHQAAVKQAIAKAKEKASQLTSDADLHLGRVVNITEDSNEYVSPMPLAMTNMAVRSKSVAPNIEPGTQDISASVGLVFEIY